MDIFIKHEIGETMNFEYYKMGNRYVLKTYKNAWNVRATFFSEDEIDKVINNIKLNGWAVMEVEA